MIETVRFLPNNGFDYVAPSDPAANTNPARVNVTWINSTNGKLFICINNTIDANVWVSYASGDITTINTQPDSYTLVLTDAGKTIEMSKATASTLTIPANASVPFRIGTCINIVQTGAGQVTVAITSDTLRSTNSNRKFASQYAAASIYKRAATEWVMVGDLIP